MDEGVDAAGRRDARRCARQQLRVQNSAGRQQLIAEHGQLVVAPVVGDDRERRDLRAGACRGRDGDERHDLARNLVRTLIFLDPAAVFCDDADRLGDIHRRAAAEGHDKVRARRLVGRRRLFDRIRRRIALGLGEGVDRKACRRERVGDLAHQTHLCQMRAGNDKCVRAAELPCGLGQLRERAAAHHDILRNGKGKVVHDKHSSARNKSKRIFLKILSVDKVNCAMVKQPRGSAHEIEIAQRFHADRGRVPRFAYFWREKVSAWELSDDSCSASVRTQIVGKTKFFDSLSSAEP